MGNSTLLNSCLILLLPACAGLNLDPSGAAYHPMPEPGLFAPQDAVAWELLPKASEVLLEAGALMTDSPEGVPIYIKTQPDEGWAAIIACGNTYITTNTLGDVVAVRVEVYWPIPSEHCFQEMKFTLAHEMIHAARAVVQLSLKEDDHSSRGLFAATSIDSTVEASTIKSVCEAVRCRKIVK